MTLDLLRFTTAGSVDDGKSTLIGRLLYDSKQVFEDQLEHVAQASERRGGEGALDLALLTDGLRAEREQGITIDVAYRYFATPRRRFIIADCPGHQQYTRNMVTGASTADLSVVLIDARMGVLEQSKRHAFISALLGIPKLVVAVNKMDLVEHSQARFEEVVQEFEGFAPNLRRDGQREGQLNEIIYIPISALRGDNVVDRSQADELVRGTNAAPPARAGGGGLRPPARPARAPARPVGHPGGRGSIHRLGSGRVPGIRRSARQRSAAPGRRGDGAARRRAHADRRDRHLRGRARGGDRTDVASRCACGTSSTSRAAS